LRVGVRGNGERRGIRDWRGLIFWGVERWHAAGRGNGGGGERREREEGRKEERMGGKTTK
jgi:hypothetical protein